jgi:hypothetical protein
VTNQIVKALEHGAQKMGKTIGEDAGKAVKEFYQDTGKRLKKVAENHVENDANHAAEMEKILKGGAKEDLPHAPGGLGGTGSHTRNGSGEEPSLGGSGRPGQSSGGNGSCRTGGDPVDVVSGQMITSATDLELPGLLPLVLRRAYASSYRGGRLHGPGWSSSIDQRVEIDLNGLHYAGDDAQILHYPLPTVSGQPVLPQHGALWPLTWDRETDTIRIEDPDRGWTRHFARPDVAPAPTSGTETRPITALSDRNDHRITFVHDDVGCPAEVRHTGGYRIAVDVIPTPAGPRIESLRVLDGTGYGQGTTIVGVRIRPARPPHRKVAAGHGGRRGGRKGCLRLGRHTTHRAAQDPARRQPPQHHLGLGTGRVAASFADRAPLGQQPVRDRQALLRHG